MLKFFRVEFSILRLIFLLECSSHVPDINVWILKTTNNNLSKAVYCSDLLEASESARFVQWNGSTLNTPFKAGLTDCQEGFAFCYGNWNSYMTVIAFAKNSNKMWAWSKASGNWVEYATKSDLINIKYLANEFNAYNDTIVLTSTATDGSKIQLSTDGTNLYLKKKLKGSTDWTMVWKK